LARTGDLGLIFFLDSGGYHSELTIDKCPVSWKIVTVMGLDDGERLIGRVKKEVS